MVSAQNIRHFFARSGIDMVVTLLHSPLEDLQMRATQIFTLFTQDTSMARLMKKSEVVPVFIAIFREATLPARMRLFAVQTLCNLVALEDAVVQLIEESCVIPVLVSGLKDRTYHLIPPYCLHLLSLLCRSPSCRDQIRQYEALRVVVEFLSLPVTFAERKTDAFLDDFMQEDPASKMFQVMDDVPVSSKDASKEDYSLLPSFQSKGAANDTDRNSKLQIMSVAAYALTHLAASFEDQEVFRAMHGISNLLKILRQYATHTMPFVLVHNFTWALAAVLAHNQASVAELCHDASAMAFVLRLSHHSQIKLRRKGLLAVAAMCQHPTGRTFVRLNEGMQWISECLQHADVHVKASALTAAAHLCEDPEAQKVMFEMGFIPSVLAMLHESTDDTLCVAVVKVLRSVTDGNVANVVIALDMDVVSQICTSLLRRHTHALVAWHLSEFLMHLRSLQAERFDADLKACGGIRALLDLTKNDQVDVVARAVAILAEVARTECKKDIFDADGVAVLSRALKWVSAGIS
jgi:hypothetical protein